MKRLIIAITAMAALAAPAAASAHQAPKPYISCGEIDGTFTNFPAGPQEVLLHVAVDGVTTVVAQHGTGPNFDTSFGFRNPDSAEHQVTAFFTWTADGGGRSAVAVKTVGNCPPDPDLTDIRNRINIQQNINNWLQYQITINTTEIKALSCKSDRIYSFRPRTSIGGVQVVGVVDRPGRQGTAAGDPDRWAVQQLSLGEGSKPPRFLISANYKGITAPKLQLRTVVSWLKLANGAEVRTKQFVRLCGGSDGNPNDTPSQARSSR